jgi:hypothetical protein
MIRTTGEWVLYLVLAYCVLALAATLLGWLEGVEAFGYAQIVMLSAMTTQQLPELYSYPISKFILSFFQYNNYQLLNFMSSKLESDPPAKEYALFNFRIEYGINGGWLLMILTLLVLSGVGVTLLRLMNDTQSSSQRCIGYLARFILPKIACILTIPVLFFSAVFLFNSQYTPSTGLTVNLILSLLSICIIMVCLGVSSYVLNAAAKTYILHVSKEKISKDIASSMADETEAQEFESHERLVEKDLKTFLGTQFYLPILWMSFFFSAVATSFTANFPIVRISLLIFSRIVFSFYVISFKPYKSLLQNLRIFLSEVLLSAQIIMTSLFLFKKDLPTPYTWCILALAFTVLAFQVVAILLKAGREVGEGCAKEERVAEVQVVRV